MIGSRPSKARGPVPAAPLLSAELQQLAARVGRAPTTLGQIISVTRGRGYHVLLVLLCLPFLTPVPLPLVSTLVGATIALIGSRLALGRKPRLPARLLRRPLPAGFAQAVLRGSSRIVRALEYLLKPRWRILHQHEVLRRLTGALIALCGLKLLLPLPVPFSNFFPASAALLMAASALEEDGVTLVLGAVVFALSTGFFVLLAFGGTTALQHLFALFTQLPNQPFSS